MSHSFQTVHCNWVQRKSPLILKVVVAIVYVTPYQNICWHLSTSIFFCLIALAPYTQPNAIHRRRGTLH